MGITYDAAKRKWSYTNEKTDYIANNKTDYDDKKPTNLPTDHNALIKSWRDSGGESKLNYLKGAVEGLYVNYLGRYPSDGEVDYWRTHLVDNHGWVPGTGISGTEFNILVPFIRDSDEARKKQDKYYYNSIANIDNEKSNQIYTTLNAKNQQANIEALAANKKNGAKNQVFANTISVASGTKGGDYVLNRDGIFNQAKELLSKAGATAGEIKEFNSMLGDTYKTFYTTEKLETWDSEKLGAKPPYGVFDPNYYKTQSLPAAQQWASAVAADDIDITQRYGEGGFYLQHYTTQGKPAGLRGNKAEVTKAAEEYLEKTPTDKDLQDARNLQLGINTDTQTERLLNIPAVSSEWEKAKKNDPYWDKLSKENFLDVNKPDEFAALFRMSDRPEDQIIRLNYNANAGYGITELEDALGEAVNEKVTVDVKKFGALTQNVLRQTIDEMKKAKAREQEISMFRGFGAFGEIVDINKELSNSLLGDTGVGGVLSFMGGGKAQESLEKSLAGSTGINTNNTIHNWQKWFDDTLKTKYEQNLELGYTTEEAKEQVKIETGFAKEFMDKYLIPRFNESRSMDEFVEYLDVRQSGQNPFETQDIVNAARLVADIRSKAYLDQLKSTPGRYFDSNFYFNPTGDKVREESYAAQASNVAADWEAAKGGDEYWKTQAYRFGIDVNDKDAFARMHFQVRGQGKGYDPADDILNASKVSDFIYKQILPVLKEETLKQGSIIGQFITPEEFADEMLRGLDPNNKGTWDELLKRYGLEGFKGTIDELKEYVKETLRTGSAQEIREEIKYLNDKRQTPSQQTLGVTYIERPEDFKDEQAKPQTELYKTFQSAGFQGTEDDFYKDFFPDMDRSEQVLLTKSGKDESLKAFGLDFSDPYASLGTVESFFTEDEPEETTDESEPKTNSYFRIAMGEDEDEPTTKSKSGASILGEFTSMFKGL